MSSGLCVVKWFVMWVVIVIVCGCVQPQSALVCVGGSKPAVLESNIDTFFYNLYYSAGESLPQGWEAQRAVRQGDMFMTNKHHVMFFGHDV